MPTPEPDEAGATLGGVTRRTVTSTRRSAGVMLAAVTAAATLTGCGQLTNPYTTELYYDAADGVSANLGDLEATDMLVVSDEKGSSGKLSGLVYNSGSSDSQLTISIGGSQQQVTIPAGESVRLDGKSNGNDGATVPAVSVPSLDGAKVGEQLQATLKTNQGGSTQLAIPVLLDQPPYGSAKVEHAEGNANDSADKSSGHGQAGH